jgi:RNA polymerase sigma-70 factor, ECF subfamily
MESDRHEQFLKLFLRHQGDLNAFVRSVVVDRARCDDVIQETALVLWREFDRYDPSRPFAAWARGVAAKNVLKSFDRAKRSPIAFSPEAIEALVDAHDAVTIDASHEREALRHCLSKLPEKSQRLVVLRYQHSLSLAEIAAQLRSTLEAVHKALSRIRTSLQQCIERRTFTGGGAV